MHTTIKNNTVFLHNGDLSGEVIIRKNNTDDEIRIPAEDLISFIKDELDINTFVPVSNDIVPVQPMKPTPEEVERLDLGIEPVDKEDEPLTPYEPKRSPILNHIRKDRESLKQFVINYVAEHGPMTNTAIRKLMYERQHPGSTYDPVRDRGYYSSYFSDSSKWLKGINQHQPAAFSYPCRGDNRILSQNASGLYDVCVVFD